MSIQFINPATGDVLELVASSEVATNIADPRIAAATLTGRTAS